MVQPKPRPGSPNHALRRSRPGVTSRTAGGPVPSGYELGVKVGTGNQPKGSPKSPRKRQGRQPYGSPKNPLGNDTSRGAMRGKTRVE
jgi:hypothetical protein